MRKFLCGAFLPWVSSDFCVFPSLLLILRGRALLTIWKSVTLLYGVLRVTLRTSKSLQLLPITVKIGATYRPCWAVRSFQTYLDIRRRPFSPKSPVFVFADGRFLTGQIVDHFLQRFLGPKYSAHSFRIGATTSASEARPAIRNHSGPWTLVKLGVLVVLKAGLNASWRLAMSGSLINQ